MTRWIWPVMSASASMRIRVGRVLFWLGAGAAALIVAVGALIAVTGDEQAKVAMPLALIFAAPFYVAGRAVCYVLAGE